MNLKRQFFSENGGTKFKHLPDRFVGLASLVKKFIKKNAYKISQKKIK